MIFLVILMLILLIGGMRIAFAIGISAFAYILVFTEMSPMVIAQRVSAGADSIVLLAIPFFLFAGEIMNEGGVTRRLVRFAMALLGSIRGGLSYVVIVVNMVMACVSGAAIASAAAVGSTMIPAMRERGYPKGFSAMLNAGAATIGPVLPPSVGFIIYASLAHASVGKLFVAGTLPGLVIGGALMIIAYVLARRRDYPRGAERNWPEVKASFRSALPSLLMPIIVLGGIIGGFVTPTEAGVLAVVYGLVLGLFVHRDIAWADLPHLLVRAANQTTVILIIIAMASAFGWIIAREVNPDAFMAFFESISEQPNVIMFMLIGLILALGTIMEGGSIMIILTPILLPILDAYGIDVVHFGVVFQLAIMIGLITPPVGILLYVVSGAGDVPVKSIIKTLWPFLLVLTVVLVLVALVPELSLWLTEVVVTK